MIILYIDTSSNKEITVGLEIDSKKDTMTEEVGRDRAQMVLPLIERLFKKHTITLQEITEISVNVGPGSFTGLRVGVSIANTLGYTLQIPVNGKPVGEFVEPIYS